MVDNPKHPTIASPCLCARLAWSPDPEREPVPVPYSLGGAPVDDAPASCFISISSLI
jgi:hypothetical protein